MRMRLLLAAAVAVGFGVFVGTAAAATTNVSIVNCAFNHGGQMTVPAGSSVTFTIGWLSRSAGVTKQFLQAETTASLDGTPVADADSYWSAPTAVSGGNLTEWSYTTGPLAAGQSETLSFDIVLSHPITDGLGNRYPAGSLFGGPLNCTITGT